MRAGAPLSQPASVSRLGHPLRTTSVTSASRSSFQSHSSGITSISTTCSSRHRHTITTSGATTITTTPQPRPTDSVVALLRRRASHQ